MCQLLFWLVFEWGGKTLKRQRIGRYKARSWKEEKLKAPPSKTEGWAREIVIGFIVPPPVPPVCNIGNVLSVPGSAGLQVRRLSLPKCPA
jgi:hypothetical protein